MSSTPVPFWSVSTCTAGDCADSFDSKVSSSQQEMLDVSIGLPGGAVCPIQYRICSNGRFFVAWKLRSLETVPPYRRGLCECCNFWCLLRLLSSLIASLHVKWLEKMFHVREVRKLRHDTERGLWGTSPPFWQICSVLYILCQLPFFGYPDWGFSVLSSQL